MTQRATGPRVTCLAVVALVLSPAWAGAQAPGGCTDAEGYDRLDFWVGEWDVTVGGQPAGTNRIEKVLAGCAVMEYWEGTGGGEGHSLFYRESGTGVWKQVWVTTTAMQPGGVKEKSEVDGAAAGAIRFQGTIRLPDGRTYLDRTTLTKLPDGSVRQVIEISTDGGGTWQSRFDGLYRRAGGR